MGWCVCAVREVLEPRVAALEVGLDRAGRAVAVLADNHFGDVRMLGLFVVDDVAIDEEDDVAILLQRTGFSKIRELRALVRPLFERAVELREREHGALELLREALEAARDLADLLLAAGLGGLRRAAHELQVIDEDEAELLTAEQLLVRAEAARA